jgi:2-oxoglutarate ferredoxin oxidoreductase subunit beta
VKSKPRSRYPTTHLVRVVGGATPLVDSPELLERMPEVRDPHGVGLRLGDVRNSTKSYASTRERYHDVAPVDFVPIRAEIQAEYVPGGAREVRMHDGSVVRFRKLDADYDPTDRDAAYATVKRLQEGGEVVTGLLYVEEDAADMHALNQTVQAPLYDYPYEHLCPGSAALDELMRELE